MSRAWALAALGVVLFALVDAPGFARASETTKLTVAFSPYRLGGNTSITSTFVVSAARGEPALPITHFDLRYPVSLLFSTSGLGVAICSPADLEAKGLEGCSPNSQIGKGSAQAEVPIGPEMVREKAQITVLKGPPQGEQVGVLIYAFATTPVWAETFFQGKIDESFNLGELIETSVPLIPSLPGASDVVIDRLQVTIGSSGLTYQANEHGKTVSYHPRGIQVPEKCPRGGFHFSLTVELADGSTVPANDTIPCPASHRGHHRKGR